MLIFHFVLICLLWLMTPTIQAQTSHERSGPAILVEIGPTRAPADSKTYKSLGYLGSQIKDAWLKTAPTSINLDNTKNVVVRFTLKNDGTIVNDNVGVEKSSGDQALDDAAVAAVRAATPFKKFPSDLKSSTIEMRITFDDDVAHFPSWVVN